LDFAEKVQLFKYHGIPEAKDFMGINYDRKDEGNNDFFNKNIILFDNVCSIMKLKS